MEADPQPETVAPSHPLRSIASERTGGAPGGDPVVHVQYFTDPLSAWCWASEPALLRLAEVVGGFVSVEYRMAGLLQSLEELTDSPSAFNRPDQIAMQWEEVAHLSGMPLYGDVWLESPPASSWPACAAVKAAQRQGAGGAARYLRRLREAALCQGADVADPEVLEALAGEAGLDAARLGEDLESGAAGEAFNADLVLAAEAGAVSAPSFFFFGPAGLSEIRGARPFEDILSAVEQVAGEPVPLVGIPTAVEDRGGYVKALAAARGSLAAAEIAELLELDRSVATDLLDRMAAGGSLRHEPAGTGRLYRPV